jgi:flagellar FliL protein
LKQQEAGMAKKQAPQSPPDLAIKSDKPGRMKLVLIVVFIVLLAIIASVLATWLLLRANDGDQAAAQPEAATARQAALYEPLTPAFVVNYEHQGRQRYLQVSMALMGRDAVAMSALKHHMPLLRNRLVLLLGRQDFEALSTGAGRELLRQQITAEVQALSQKEVGAVAVQQVLFTNFVLQ